MHTFKKTKGIIIQSDKTGNIYDADIYTYIRLLQLQIQAKRKQTTNTYLQA